MAQAKGKTEVATKAVTGDVETAPPFDPNAADWWNAAGSDTVIGHDLANNENGLIDALVGVPFMITKVFYRASAYAAKGIEWRPAMVTCEAVIPPEEVLKRRRVDMSKLPWEPGSQIVFNDCSTGISRQITEYLAAKGLVVVPEGEKVGSYGVSVYDLPPAEWVEIHGGDVKFTDDGFQEYEANVRLVCPRGLRVSTYENEYSKDGKTRYIA